MALRTFVNGDYVKFISNPRNVYEPPKGTYGQIVIDENGGSFVKWILPDSFLRSCYGSNCSNVQFRTIIKVSERKAKGMNEEITNLEEVAEEEVEEFVCPNCGQVFDDEDKIHGDVCEDCGSICDHCGEWAEDMTEVYVRNRERNSYRRYNSSYVCNDCLETHFTSCADCDNFYSESEMISVNDGDRYVCNSCYEDHYGTCEECGETFHSDDLNYHNDCQYCDSCMPKGVIMGYHDRPRLVFHRDSDDFSTLDGIVRNFRENFFIGTEIEIANDDMSDKQLNEVAEELYNDIGEDRIFFNYDGSVCGFECITHPAHFNKFKSWDWERFFRTVNNNDFDTNGCGVHIHVSRKGLGRDESEQDMNIMKILFFMEKFWESVVKFSRRDIDRIEQWAKPYNYNADTEKIPDLQQKIRDGRHDRYHSVNLTNRETIEFRIFNGTVSKSELLAAVDFVYYLCLNAIQMDVNEIQDKKFRDFFAGADETFWNYCTTNGVNEEEKELFDDFAKEGMADLFEMNRINGLVYVHLKKDPYFYKVNAKTFADKYGYDILNIILKRDFGITKDIVPMNFEENKRYNLTPVPNSDAGFATSFDGVMYRCTNFDPLVYESDGTIMIENIRWERNYWLAFVTKSFKKTYLRKFEETRILAELFGRLES